MERIFGSGGMPSSHSSTVCAAATVVCRLYGPDSAIFGVMVIMSVIVMYDAKCQISCRCSGKGAEHYTKRTKK